MPIPETIGPADQLFEECKHRDRWMPLIVSSIAILLLLAIGALWLFLANLLILKIIASVIVGLPALLALLFFGSTVPGYITERTQVYGNRLVQLNGEKIDRAIRYADVVRVSDHRMGPKRALIVHPTADDDFHSLMIWTSPKHESCSNELFVQLRDMCFDIVRAKIIKEIQNRGAYLWWGFLITPKGLEADGQLLPYDSLRFKKERKRNWLTISLASHGPIFEMYISEPNIEVGLEVIELLKNDLQNPS